MPHFPTRLRKKPPQALSLDLFSLAENGTLVGMKALAEGDRWFSPPSCCVQPHQMDTADPWFECLLLHARRTRRRRARVLSASPCYAGGARGVFGGLRSLLRGSGTLVCKATIGRVQGWFVSTKNLYFVSRPPAQPRGSRHTPPKTRRNPPASPESKCRGE